jgi:hypothetical protein
MPRAAANRRDQLVPSPSAGRGSHAPSLGPRAVNMRPSVGKGGTTPTAVRIGFGRRGLDKLDCTTFLSRTSRCPRNQGLEPRATGDAKTVRQVLMTCRTCPTILT